MPKGKVVEAVEEVEETLMGEGVGLGETSEPEPLTEQEEHEVATAFSEVLPNGDGAVSPEPNRAFYGIWSRETAGSKGLKVLLYGASGSGKTRMAATFPDPIFLDLEGGLRTTLQVKSVLRYPANPHEDITDLEQVKKFYSLVRGQKDPPFQTIVIDSLNELQNLILKNVLKRFDANRQYEDQPTISDYGKIIRDFTTIIKLFIKLPFHVVFTAVETPREFSEQQVFPQFIGKKTGPEVQRLLEMIGYVFVQTGADGSPEHLVSFHGSPLWVAKDRMGIVDSEIPNDYEEMVGSAVV